MQTKHLKKRLASLEKQEIDPIVICDAMARWKERGEVSSNPRVAEMVERTLEALQAIAVIQEGVPAQQ